MANLETMRTFQKHWSSYGVEERRLAELCTHLPLRCDCLTAQDRRAPLLVQPQALAYNHKALEDALGADGAHWGYQANEGTQWGWWLADDAWQAQGQISRLLGDRAAACAELAALALACQASKDGDAQLTEARSKLRTYTEADAAEREELEDLEQRRAEVERPYTEEAARTVPALLRPWHRLRLWFLRHVTLRDELDKLDQKRADMRAKLEVRERKLAELNSKEAARTAELDEPFAAPTAAVLEAVDATEDAVRALYDRDLTARDAAYEAGALDDAPFAEAVEAANEREWALLEQWMAAYVERLPEKIVHARNVMESELAWLEVHAPYGKRYWPLTDQVVAAMEQGRADTSELALKLVRQ